MSRRGAALSLAVLLPAGALLAGIWYSGGPPLVEVPPGTSLSRIAADAADGTVLRLLPGAHGPVRIDRRLAVEGTPGAWIRGPVRVLASGVRLRDLRIVGGETGVEVREAEDVVIEDVTIRGAEIHGIEVADGSVTVTGCHITALESPYAQGFEIRNANGRPRSVVRGCTAASGQEGLVSHVSRVEFRDNRISGTSRRAVAVTEMSEGLVEGNRITGVSGVALYCGDMSHCDVRNNTARGVSANPSAGRSYEGYGAAAWYHSRMRLAGNTFEVDAPRPVRVAIGSKLTEEMPMGIWPAGWRGALPGLFVSAAALVALLAVRTALTPWLRRRRRTVPRPSARWGRVQVPIRTISARAGGVLLAGFVVQSFHMLEHGVQVFQVYVADAEHRSGLAGSVADTEWVHFLYNSAVLAFLLWAWRTLAREAAREGGWRASSTFLPAAALIQVFHQVEHTAKLIQHLATGVDPAPGLVGHVAGLVWFHYAINLAVYAGLAIALAPRVKELLRVRPDRGSGSEWVQTRPRELHPHPHQEFLEVP